MKSQKIGFGTAAIGRPHYINIRSNQPAAFELESFKAKGTQVLESAYQQGVRYFDTAPGYGMAEQLILEWLKTKKDDSIEVATKWGYAYVANFDPDAKIHEVKEHSVKQLIQQWEVSKELLPFLTTLQIHSATFETGVLDDSKVLRKLAEIKSKQGIKIGLSTTGDNQVDVLKKAVEIKVEGEALFEVFQITYNILDQSLMSVLELIHKNENRIIIKEAMANGRILPNSNYPEYADLYRLLESYSQKYNVGVDAIALQFCVQTLSPFMVLSGASETAHLKGNLKANDFEFSAEELEKLKAFGLDPKQYWQQRKQMQWN
jgi:aryl-alcohol dehydrogenase-like predicted oxidoreductase